MSRQNGIDRNSKDKQYLRNIDDNIITARRQRGYSQEEFADISVLNLIKIMEALNIEPNEIIGSAKVKQ